MSPQPVTPEDAAILAALRSSTRSAYATADAIDGRAMMAREVHAERRWRLAGHPVTPRDCERDAEAAGGSLRKHYESIHGEPLA